MFFFSKNSNLDFEPDSIEHAYLVLLKNDLSQAKKIFKQQDSPRAKWGLVLVDILNGYLEHFPTYFGIRNFLEIDLDFLIKNEKIEYVELILGSLKILNDINQETYKYVARVMLENRLNRSAFEYLTLAKDCFYNDPELHFLFAKYYLRIRDYNQADYYLDECLNVIPEYYPAKLLQKEISRYLA